MHVCNRYIHEGQQVTFSLDNLIQRNWSKIEFNELAINSVICYNIEYNYYGCLSVIGCLSVLINVK